jgi:hypothetical protein
MRALLLLCLLTACTPPYATGCPSPVEYSPEFQKRAQAQLQTLDPLSPVPQMIVDYGQLRAAVRACAG